LRGSLDDVFAADHTLGRLARHWYPARHITEGKIISAHVQVFGCLHDDPIHARRRQAYEKRQWTKSREVGRLRCGWLYEGLIGTPTPTLMVRDGTSREGVDGAFKRVMPLPVWNQ